MANQQPFEVRPGAKRLTTGKHLLLTVVAFSLLASPALLHAADMAGQEILYPGASFAKLDTF